MRILIIFIIVLCSCPAAHSAPPTAESVDTLLAALDSENRLGGKVRLLEDLMRKSVADRATQQNLSPEQQQALEVETAKMVKLIQRELGWEEMRQIYTQIYTEVFTQEEVDGLITFLRTPAGKALIEKSPAVDKKAMEIMQARMTDVQERIKKAMEEMFDDVQVAN